MRKGANEIYIHSFPGCGVDWAVTPLSRIATVAYLVVGAPILYYYFTRVGRALSAALHFIGYQVQAPFEWNSDMPLNHLFVRLKN